MYQLNIHDPVQNVPLAPLTTLGIGGEARCFITASSEDEVSEAVAYANARGLEIFVLGGGSNVLVSDEGFDGLVIKIAIKGVQAGDDGIVTAGAGENWDDLVRFCVDNSFAGIECLSGIPGLVGATPIQNVGAYGQEVSESIISVRCFDRRSMQTVELSNSQCGFSYRSSIFNAAEAGRYIVLGVKFALKKGGRPKVVYRDLVEHFPEGEPTLREVRDAVIAIRRAKSMVIDAGDPDSKSAGSFFKNPIVSPGSLEDLRRAFPALPSFAFGDDFKVPAAWLIENAGFAKGTVRGNVGISSKHTLALINRGGATARELLALKDEIREAVYAKFGIELQPEPILIGSVS